MHQQVAERVALRDRFFLEVRATTTHDHPLLAVSRMLTLDHRFQLRVVADLGRVVGIGKQDLGATRTQHALADRPPLALVFL